MKFLPDDNNSLETAKFDDATSNAVTSRDCAWTGRGRAASRSKMAAVLRSIGDSEDKMASKMASWSRDCRATAPSKRLRNSVQIASSTSYLFSGLTERIFCTCAYIILRLMDLIHVIDSGC